MTPFYLTCQELAKIVKHFYCSRQDFRADCQKQSIGGVLMSKIEEAIAKLAAYDPELATEAANELNELILTTDKAIYHCRTYAEATDRLIDSFALNNAKCAARTAKINLASTGLFLASFLAGYIAPNPAETPEWVLLLRHFTGVVLGAALGGHAYMWWKWGNVKTWMTCDKPEGENSTLLH
jgi:hypothetical protein